MIAAHHFGADEGAFETWTQRGTDEEIVNAPANVPRTRAGHRTPPGVMSPALFKFAERVHETRLDERPETGAFLRRETVVVNVGLRVGEVNFRVRHIEVAAENYGLFLLQFFQVVQEVAIPLLTISEPGEFTF